MERHDLAPEYAARQAALAESRGWYVDEFIRYIAVERGLAKRTLVEYREDLEIFLDFYRPLFADGLSLEGMDARTIREFLYYLRVERNYSDTALNRKISCLKSYFRFLVLEQHIPHSPMDEVHSSKQHDKLPKTLDCDDMEQVLEAANRRIAQDPGNWLPVRDLAIVELFYATGIRLAELVGTNLADFNFAERQLLVTGKGNKQRLVFMNKAAIAALKRYLACRPTPVAKCTAVFLNRFRARLSRRAVEIIFDKICDEAGLLKPASPHTLRHSFATQMLEGGSDLVTIQELLGHCSLSTTQIYTNISRAHMHKTYENSHPRE